MYWLFIGLFIGDDTKIHINLVQILHIKKCVLPIESL